MNKILAVSFLFLLSGCVAAPLVLTGIGATSVAVNETTGRTITDQTVSAINGQDCRISRAFQNQAVCQDEALTRIQITNTVTKPSSVAEIEARYR
jgi:hypothetical protein